MNPKIECNLLERNDMSFALRLALNLFKKAILPILREYVKQTATPLDDAALDLLEGVLNDGEFQSFASVKIENLESDITVA